MAQHDIQHNLTIEQIAEDIILTFSGGKINANVKFSKEHVVSLINQARAPVIQRYYMERMYRDYDNNWFQDHVTERVSEDRLPDGACYQIYECPPVIFMPGTESLMVCDEHYKFFENHGTAHRSSHLSDNPEMRPGRFKPSFFWNAGKIYLYGANEMTRVIARGIFQNPLDIQVRDYESVRPFDRDNDAYPISSNFLPQIKEYVESKMSVMMQMPVDEWPDGTYNLQTGGE